MVTGRHFRLSGDKGSRRCVGPTNEITWEENGKVVPTVVGRVLTDERIKEPVVRNQSKPGGAAKRQVREKSA